MKFLRHYIQQSVEQSRVNNAAQVITRYLDALTFQPTTIPTPQELTAMEVLLRHATTKRDA